MKAKLGNLLVLASASTMMLFALCAKASSSSSAAKTSETATLRFAIADKHGFPLEESQEYFDCLDKVYAVTEVSNFDKGKHAIEFRWIDPNGDPREHTRYDFFVTNKPKLALWAWLELSRAQGAAIIQWINPAAGMEEFIGSWEVEIFIDGKSFEKRSFEISC